MFVGHYGAALIAKAVAPRLSIGVYFFAVQALDVLFCGLVLAGVERVRIVPGFTECNAYDLFFMPYSHSLFAAAAWSLATGAAFWAVRRQPREAVALGAAVLSHFLLDLPVHTPDLPLLGDSSPKIGLGLWNHRAIATAVEVAALAAGWAWLSTQQPMLARAMRVFGGVLLALALVTPFLPPPAGPREFALEALASYFVLAFVAGRIERRSQRT